MTGNGASRHATPYPRVRKGARRVRRPHLFDHCGVSPRALVRAAIQNIRNGRIVSGGSTLTMQVIRLSRQNRGHCGRNWSKYAWPHDWSCAARKRRSCVCMPPTPRSEATSSASTPPGGGIWEVTGPNCHGPKPPHSPCCKMRLPVSIWPGTAISYWPNATGCWPVCMPKARSTRRTMR